MKVRPATEEELSRWDTLIAANPDGGHYMQTAAWAAFKEHHGWIPYRFIAEEGETRAAFLVLERKVPIPGIGKLWYANRGPGVADAKSLTAVAKALQPHVPKGVFAVKFEPELDLEVHGPALKRQKVLRKAPLPTQNSATVIVPLEASEEEILASFKQKTRYNVRLAAKKGVTVEAVPATDENFELMFGLMRATQERSGMFAFPREYFFDYWRRLTDAGQGQIFFARHEGDLLAGVFAIFNGCGGWYKDGGSVRQKTNLMAPYLLQWEVMRWLKSHGVTRYDMIGVPPKAQLDESHPTYSLYGFKIGFHQESVDFVGGWDLVLDEKRWMFWSKYGHRLTIAAWSRLKRNLWY